jgi:hypothetical protein
MGKSSSAGAAHRAGLGHCADRIIVALVVNLAALILAAEPRCFILSDKALASGD